MQNDAISRSAVLRILSDEFDMAAEERAEADNEKDRAFNAGEIHCARRSTSRVNDLPALDVVPVVHARWIPHDEVRPGLYLSETCSNCGNDVEHLYPLRVNQFSNYCSDCGARMDGEAE